jgi:cytochrome c553
MFLYFTITAAAFSQQAGMPATQPQDGAAIYQRRCARCHEDPDQPRAPRPDAMTRFSPEYILRALQSGVMMPQGSRLSAEERRTVAEFLSGKPLSADAETKPKGRAKSKSAGN